MGTTEVTEAQSGEQECDHGQQWSLRTITLMALARLQQRCPRPEGQPSRPIFNQETQPSGVICRNLLFLDNTVLFSNASLYSIP